MIERRWAVLPYCSGLCLCAGCVVDHLVHGSPIFALGLGLVTCLTLPRWSWMV